MSQTISNNIKKRIEQLEDFANDLGLTVFSTGVGLAFRCSFSGKVLLYKDCETFEPISTFPSLQGNTLQVLANDKKETYIPHGIVKSSF